ncbi:MAG TPA: hypothetical protein ENN08_00750 [Bacteroidales bacterium]|nr:hypothetical protein [Bacteroidales bacterium]
MQKEAAKIKTCPSCGATFGCMHSMHCWCAAYTIPKESMELIRTSFNDCLCEACLLKYVSAAKDTSC